MDEHTNYIKNSIDINKKLLKSTNSEAEYNLVLEDIRYLETGIPSSGCSHTHTSVESIDNFICILCLDCASFLDISSIDYINKLVGELKNE